MKKGQVLEGIIERVDFPNKGIINIEGTRVIVKNGIPGQRIRFSINKVRSGKGEGRLLEVLEKAPEEQEALCPHFPDCGGCTYQNLPYENQLRMKEEQIRRLLDSVSSDYEFEGIKASPEQYGYRNKMEFSFGDEYKDGPLALGMHRRGSFYDIVTSSSCQIVDEDYHKILDATLEFARESGLSFYHKITHQGYFRHLLIRRGKRSGEILVDLITSSQDGEISAEVRAGAPGEGIGAQKQGISVELATGAQSGEIPADLDTGTLTGKSCPANGSDMSILENKDNEERQIRGNQVTDTERKRRAENQIIKKHIDLHVWAERIQNLSLSGKIAGILHTVNDSVADVVKNDGTEILYGQDYFYEELLGMKFKISPFSFFQTNSLGAEVLYETARSYIGDTKEKVIFDLYSGTGTIAQVLAPVAKHVTGVEIVEEAVEAAKVNASLNGLSNCDFIAGDVLKVLDSLTERPDLIVLDPPRDGIHPRALEKIIRYGVERMVYISCKPTSLVRDLEVLLANGYRMERACAVDLFPGTYHTETVVLLGNQKTKPDSHNKLSVDMDEFNKVKNGEK